MFDDAYVKLALHFEGADGSTTFTDSSSSAHAFTAYGDAKISTARAAVGNSSGLFNGSNAYITTGTHADFNLSNGEFTIETKLWINSVQAPANMIVSCLTTSGYGWSFYFTSTLLCFQYATTSSNKLFISVPWTPTTGKWLTVAVERYGNILRFFVNGFQVGTDQAFNVTIYNTGGNVELAREPISGYYYYLNGNLDEFCFSKGIARYHSNYYPLATPEATHTLSANLKKNVLGDYSLAANIFARSFETQAYLLKGISDDFSLAGILKKTISGSLALGAKLVKVELTSEMLDWELEGAVTVGTDKEGFCTFSNIADIKRIMESLSGGRRRYLRCSR